MKYTVFDTEWGAFGYVVRGKRLVATFMLQSGANVRRAIRRDWPEAVETPNALPGFRKQVTDYFAGKLKRFAVDVDLSDVPPFRQSVLRACQRIPYGKTAAYADLARAAGSPGACRAAGGAMAHNPIPLVIPCHRVLRSDGSIGGFSSRRGVKDKQRLLRLEGARVPE